jgi:hypothetical protein
MKPDFEAIRERWERQYRSLDQEFGVVLDLDVVWRDIGDLIERVEKLERVAEAAKELNDELEVMYQEYGIADDHALTRDGIDLKHAINRVMEELELHVMEPRLTDALAALEKVRDE